MLEQEHSHRLAGSHESEIVYCGACPRWRTAWKGPRKDILTHINEKHPNEGRWIECQNCNWYGPYSLLENHDYYNHGRRI